MEEPSISRHDPHAMQTRGQRWRARIILVALLITVQKGGEEMWHHYVGDHAEEHARESLRRVDEAIRNALREVSPMSVLEDFMRGIANPEQSGVSDLGTPRPSQGQVVGDLHSSIVNLRPDPRPVDAWHQPNQAVPPMLPGESVGQWIARTSPLQRPLTDVAFERRPDPRPVDAWHQPNQAVPPMLPGESVGQWIARTSPPATPQVNVELIKASAGAPHVAPDRSAAQDNLPAASPEGLKPSDGAKMAIRMEEEEERKVVMAGASLDFPRNPVELVARVPRGLANIVTQASQRGPVHVCFALLALAIGFLLVRPDKGWRWWLLAMVPVAGVSAAAVLFYLCQGAYRAMHSVLDLPSMPVLISSLVIFAEESLKISVHDWLHQLATNAERVIRSLWR